ncbi:MAG: hypothetical protein KF905_06675 [Flavobacteriales bacterium]|nr:hypothetical protein [Flavobacteriales bacterium]
MIRWSVLLLLIVCLQTGLAQAPSRVLPFIHFSDEREEKSFNKLLEEPTADDVLTVLLLTDLDRKGIPVDDARRRLALFIHGHKERKGAALSEKHLRQIFNEVQSTFLVRYDAQALFGDLFTKGDFNCVTASALFALILNDLDIPYGIHLTPDHMYLATMVQGDPAVIETTDPVRGVFVVSQRARKKYVQEILRAKRISHGQIDSLGLDGALATLVTNDTVIDLRATVGTHYHNAGVFAADHDLQKGIDQLAKAYMLHASPHTKELLQLALLRQVEQLSYETFEDVRFLLDTYAFIEPPTMDRHIPTDHARLLDKHLIHRGDTAFVNSILDAFLELPRSEEARRKIRFQHHVEMGRYHALKRQWDPAVEHLLIAYSIEPDHVQVSALVTEALVHRLDRLPDRSSYVAHLDELVAMHPELKGTPGIQHCYQIVYLIAAEDHFNIDERRKAEMFLKKFEALYEREEDLPVNAVARAYIAGWRSWARARDSDKARNYLSRGLKIAPFNEDLHRASRYSTY